MNANAARMEFAPPPTPGLLRALGLAIVAHALLLAVLTLGVQWKRDATPVTVEAELWSALPVQAAPKPPEPVLPPPEPVQPPVAKEVVAPPPVPVPVGPDPAIAIAKEKARLQKEKQLEQDRQELEKRQKEAIKAKKLKEEKEARELALQEKLAREKKLQQEQQKAQLTKTDTDAKKIAEQLRKQQIDRMTRMADQATGSGDASSTGSAKQSSGPSASYRGRIIARIKPNITYTGPIDGNLVADVDVRTSPDGTIISRKLVKSSGNRSWDEAVINAIDKTEKLPPDIDGRVSPWLIIGFRPTD